MTECAEGPFLKGHPLYDTLYAATKDLIAPWKTCGKVYERDDRYGGFWIANSGLPTQEEEMRAAETIRARMNEAAGYSAIAKPEWHDKYSEDNPYTCPAILLCLMSRSVAERAARYGGDPMAAALARCREAGIEVKL
jgi:hypothetical protein